MSLRNPGGRVRKGAVNRDEEEEEKELAGLKSWAELSPSVFLLGSPRPTSPLLLLHSSSYPSWMLPEEG